MNKTKKNNNENTMDLTFTTLIIILIITILCKIASIYGIVSIVSCISVDMLVFFMGIFEPYISSKYNKKVRIRLCVSYMLFTIVLIIITFF